MACFSVFLLWSLFSILSAWCVVRIINGLRRSQNYTVAFFHPYCNAGGGGERVLWSAMKSLYRKYPNYDYVVYTGDVGVTAQQIKSNAKNVFNISLPDKLNLKIVYLKLRPYVEAKKYPYFTLIGQSMGSVLLGIEAMCKYAPHVYVDSMGYAFTYPIFKFLVGCQIAAYVHYPTISTDMLNVVKDRSGSFNNRTFIANSRILTKGKLWYYHIFAFLYGVVGSCANKVMVNSSWTKNHIVSLWSSSKPVIVYPPCDITEFLKLPSNRESCTKNVIVSIGQFRPEKNHTLQVKSFAKFISGINKDKRDYYELILMGGCRNKSDEVRIDKLNALCIELGVEKNIKIKSNIGFEDLKSNLSKATVGIHTMSNEHFGIGVVEFQAAGVIALAHKSAGPLMDIVVGTEMNNSVYKTGYLATDVDEYAEMLHEIFSLSAQEKDEIIKAAKVSCLRFSEEHFEQEFLNQLDDLLQ